MFQTKVVEKLETRISCSINFFFEKSYSLWDNVEKYGTARQATDDNIIRRMRIACWIKKGYEHTIRTCNTYCFSTAKNSCTNASHCYVIRTLPVL